MLAVELGFVSCGFSFVELVIDKIFFSVMVVSAIDSVTTWLEEPKIVDDLVIFHSCVVNCDDPNVTVTGSSEETVNSTIGLLGNDVTIATKLASVDDSTFVESMTVVTVFSRDATVVTPTELSDDMSGEEECTLEVVSTVVV